MNNFNESVSAITATLRDYFGGIFRGDVDLLKSTFHPQALVSGDINGQPYFKTLDQYLDGVKNRKSPAELGETFRMEILSVEIINTTAIAKVRVPLFEFNYYDLLSLVMINDKWVIINKLLTHVKS
jgi:hypothetical protein